MNYSVYLRPLSVTDAEQSAIWRNNPRIWKYTGSKPTIHITAETEREWIRDTLHRTNEKRFAICVSDTDQYIGNVFLTDISDRSATIHIFIGDIAFWGHNHAYDALIQLITYAFDELHLEQVDALINEKNYSSAALSHKLGFEKTGSTVDEKTQKLMYTYMLTRQKWSEKRISEKVESGNH